MAGIRQYLLTVIAAALICAVFNTISSPKGAVKGILKLLSGVFLALSVISPLLDIGQIEISEFTQNLQSDAVETITLGKSMAAESASQIIKEKTAAYILDKAESMNLDIEVEVCLDDSFPQQPCGVTIKGSISPYARETLKEYIEKNLGIKKENQWWR